MSSESEDETFCKLSEKRLGTCEACNNNPAKYSCPRCEVKTCGLSCLNLHKRELKCDGIRDKTKYVSLAKMTKIDLLQDYYFLEECTKFVENRKRDRIKGYARHNNKIASHLFRLRQAANDRQTNLLILQTNFTQRQKNTSFLDFKSGTIFWRIEWCFSNGNEMFLYADDRLCENVKLYEAVDKYLSFDENVPTPGAGKLTIFQARGISGIQFLLKAQGTKQCRNRFFLLDSNKSIRECLSGRTVVEFPTVFVVLKDKLLEYDIIESDDDLDSETRKYMCGDRISSSRTIQNIKAGQTTDAIVNQLDQMNIKRINDKQEHTKISNCQNFERMNYLFSNECISNEPSSESDNGNLSEGDIELASKKRLKFFE